MDYTYTQKNVIVSTSYLTGHLYLYLLNLATLLDSFFQYQPHILSPIIDKVSKGDFVALPNTAGGI